MLCRQRKLLNASATADCLPDAHHEHPSRAAGSFFGQLRTLRLIWCNVRVQSKAVLAPTARESASSLSAEAAPALLSGFTDVRTSQTLNFPAWPGASPDTHRNRFSATAFTISGLLK